jgi:hypothetical protein
VIHNETSVLLLREERRAEAQNSSRPGQKAKDKRGDKGGMSIRGIQRTDLNEQMMKVFLFILQNRVERGKGGDQKR